MSLCVILFCVMPSSSLFANCSVKFFATGQVHSVRSVRATLRKSKIYAPSRAKCRLSLPRKDVFARKPWTVTAPCLVTTCARTEILLWFCLQNFNFNIRFVKLIISGEKFIFVTGCLRGEIVNMFGQKTELRSTRFGVKFRDISCKK